MHQYVPGVYYRASIYIVTYSEERKDYLNHIKDSIVRKKRNELTNVKKEFADEERKCFDFWKWAGNKYRYNGVGFYLHKIGVINYDIMKYFQANRKCGNDNSDK